MHRPRLSRDRAAGRFGARTLLAAGALLALAVPFGLLLLLVQTRWPPLAAADEAVRDGLYGYAVRAPGFVLGMKAVSLLGTSAAYAVLFLPLAWWLARSGLRRLALFVVVAVGGGALLNAAVKALVDRARPTLPEPVASGSFSSFPSGHAQGVVVASGVLLLVMLPALRPALRPVAVAAAACWVLLMGFSRLALGVHYLSDVLAGYAFGLAWLLACTAAFRAWRVERGRPAGDLRRGLEPEAGRRLRDP